MAKQFLITVEAEPDDMENISEGAIANVIADLFSYSLVTVKELEPYGKFWKEKEK